MPNIGPFPNYRPPSADPTWGIKIPKTCAYRATIRFHVAEFNITIGKGDTLYSIGDEYLYVHADKAEYSTQLDPAKIRGAITVGWLEAIPAVPYEKPLPRTRFERILDDSDGVCPSSSVERAVVS
jgi:hypothetical protein